MTQNLKGTKGLGSASRHLSLLPRTPSVTEERSQGLPALGLQLGVPLQSTGESILHQNVTSSSLGMTFFYCLFLILDCKNL